MLLDDLFGKAITADKKARLRTLKDLDQSAAALAEACHLLLDLDVPDESLRKKVFAKIPRAALENALERVSVLIRPPDDAELGITVHLLLKPHCHIERQVSERLVKWIGLPLGGGP
jgi:hypothetical protein